MNQIFFNNGEIIGSNDSFNLILSSKIIGMPQTKTKIVDITGSDGVLDFTDYLGSARYGTRQLSFTFTVIGSDAMSNYESFCDFCHGKRFDFWIGPVYVTPSTPSIDYYYSGRFSVGDITFSKGIGTFSVVAVCDPWKLKRNETYNSFFGSGQKVLSNGRMPVVPKITCGIPEKITFMTANGIEMNESATLDVGYEWIVPEFEMVSGSNKFKIEQNPYVIPTNPITRNRNGIDYVLGTDGVLTASGTATNTSSYYYFTNTKPTLGGFNYALSGCTDGSLQTYYLYLKFYDENKNGIENIRCTNAKITGRSPMNAAYYSLYFLVLEGVTLNNYTITPKLEYETDFTYREGEF